MTEAPAPFTLLLKQHRLAAGMTQEMLAERAGMSERGIQDLERGRRRRPRHDTAGLLAEALGLAASDRAVFLAAAQRWTTPSSRGLAGAPSLPPATDLSTLLVGREREMAVLGQFLAGRLEMSPAPPVLLVAGEPGIGKTSLLQAFTRHAAAAGWRLLAGGSQRRGGQAPYVPLVDALAASIHALAPKERRHALEGCAWLGRLLPELGTPLDTTLAPDQERRLIYGAVERFLTNVAGPAGTLLVLDDLHWAGPDALDLVHSLARTANPRLRIVGAYRDTETRPPDPLNGLLSDLAQARLVHRLPLGPLAAADAETLLAGLLAGVAADYHVPAGHALARSGGIPFFLVSYAQALRQGSTEGVPWDLAQGVRQRVALLPETGRRLLDAAAVVGRQVSRVVLLAGAQLSEEDALAGLRAVCLARLLLEDRKEGYVFAHDVIREVVEADMGAAQREVLHRKVAEALESDPTCASPETLAYHYTRAGILGKVVHYLEQAGDHAWAQRAHSAAEDRYGETLERLERLGRGHDAARVREKLGEVLYRAGHYDAALAVLEPAAVVLQGAADWERLGPVVAWMGRAHSLRGTPRAGVALITAFLEQLDRSRAAPPSLAALYEVLGWLLFTAGEYGASLPANEMAAALARADGDQRTQALADGQRINALQMLGRLGEALQLGETALPLAEAVGDLESMWRAHIDLAYIHALRGALESSRRHSTRALAVAEQMEEPGQLLFVHALRAWLVGVGGASTEGRAALDAISTQSRAVDRSWYISYPLIFRARLSLAAGDWADAATAVEEALTLTTENGDFQALRWTSSIRAELDILEGRAEAAKDRLVPLLDRPGLEECDVTLLLPVLAWAQLELGQIDEAAETIEQALGRARPEGMRLVLVEALRIQAMVALSREQWEAATRILEEGLTLARDMPYPYAEARLLQVYGALHTRKGEPETARERLEAARIIFTRLSARRNVVTLFQPGVDSR
jgi:tetratricopeptide (TPR) repeat protein/transcriptional regulator with XRE-family HTH domain